MKFDLRKYHRPFNTAQGRRSIRLADYDYSQPGAYFITIVTRGRECVFGEVRNGEMQRSEVGRIVWDMWNSLPARYPQIELGTATVMPNHFHGIIDIHQTPIEVIPVGVIPVAAIHELPLRERRHMLLPLVVGYFKMNTAKRINAILGSQGVPVWQRNYGACPEPVEGNTSYGTTNNTTGFIIT
jgi:hypothetical protein